MSKKFLTEPVFSVRVFCGKFYLTVLCLIVNVLEPGEGFY